jgi:predicted MFS family arabinose efflux permease
MASAVDPVAPVLWSLGRRLLPLHVGAGLAGFMLWVPVEKLFMSEIGFDAASVGVMAAAYSAVVPLLEVPSGIVADRWSRKWLLVASSGALVAVALIAALAQNVLTYIVSAMVLGVYFALYSGTLDSIVYDAVIEQTGSSDPYERWIGRVRIVESGALVGSAFTGGFLAQLTSTRLTYWLSIPFAAAAMVAFARLDEPQLHKQTEQVPLRDQAAATLRAMRSSDLRQAMLVASLAALLSQTVFEFGPLWLVAMNAPAGLFGPYWAALVATIGLGGYLTSKLHLARRPVLLSLIAGLLACSVVLTLTTMLTVVVLVQTAMALILGMVGIHAGLLVHDAVPSSIRAGVSSGVGTLAWAMFLPFSLGFGLFTAAFGVHRAGWVLVATTVTLAVLLVRSPRSEPTTDEARDGPMPAAGQAAQQTDIDDAVPCAA